MEDCFFFAWAFLGIPTNKSSYLSNILYITLHHYFFIDSIGNLFLKGIGSIDVMTESYLYSINYI